MSVIAAFVKDLEANWTDGTIEFGTPTQPGSDFVVVLPVNPDEQPTVLCEDQGDAGVIDIQLSGVGRSSGAARVLLESCHDYVMTMRGVISDGTHSYQIVSNTTNGVRRFDASLNTWQCLFETRIEWQRIS